MPMKTQDEIDEVLGTVQDSIEFGIARFPGQTYEEGVDHALRWVTGDLDEDPYPDE